MRSCSMPSPTPAIWTNVLSSIGGIGSEACGNPAPTSTEAAIATGRLGTAIAKTPTVTRFIFVVSLRRGTISSRQVIVKQ